MLFVSVIGPSYEEALAQIAENCELRIDKLVCTEGELLSLRKKVRGKLLLTLGNMPLPRGIAPDLIDIPWDRDLPEAPCPIIRSIHNFHETPPLDALFAQISAKPAYAYKIATFANSTLDALRMLAFVKKSDVRLTGICMGPLGEITRILAPVVGGFCMYASSTDEKAAAPGQLSIDTLEKIYHYSALSQKTRLYGLIGSPIVQSPSYRTHNAFFRAAGLDAVYVRMQIEPHELAAFFPLARELGFRGLSVTIPHKERLFDYVEASEEARVIGAVNTLLFSDGEILGSNTDAAGGLDALEDSVAGKLIVILGAGGSAKALAYEAKKRGARVCVANRSLKGFADCLLEDIPEHYDILINTMPASYPTGLDINFKHPSGFGEKMFVRQAEGQFKLWFPEKTLSFCQDTFLALAASDENGAAAVAKDVDRSPAHV